MVHAAPKVMKSAAPTAATREAQLVAPVTLALAPKSASLASAVRRRLRLVKGQDAGILALFVVVEVTFAGVKIRVVPLAVCLMTRAIPAAASITVLMANFAVLETRGVAQTDGSAVPEICV